MLEPILTYAHCCPLLRSFIRLAALLFVSACVSACIQDGQLLLATEDQYMASACQPALRMVTGRPFSARNGPMEVHAIAVVAGCKSDLEKIAPDKDEELVSRALAPFVLEQGGATSQHSMTSQAELVAEINSFLGDELVTDAVVYRLSWAERIPSD